MTQRPSWMCAFRLYENIIGLIASVPLLYDLMFASTGNSWSNNSHKVMTGAAAIPSADTPSQLK